MNRQALAFAAVVSVAAFAAGLFVRVQDAAAGDGPAPAPASTPASSPKPPATRAELIADLTTILRETESTDTFLLTLQSILAQDPTDKSVLPLVLRKAEKLGLLEGALFNPRPEQQLFLRLLAQVNGTAPQAGYYPPGSVPAYAPAPGLVPSQSFEPPMAPSTTAQRQIAPPSPMIPE